MRISEGGIKTYDITTVNNVKNAIADKTVNRWYTCEVDGGTTYFHPTEFSLCPRTSGEKILWGSPEYIDTTKEPQASQPSINNTYNTEDYVFYGGSAKTIYDDEIVLGNISGVTGTAKKRDPFFTNGYGDGKFVTNVINNAVVTAATYSADAFCYIFDVTGIVYSQNDPHNAFSLRFPNGYIANCSRSGTTNSLRCYMLDGHNADVIVNMTAQTDTQKRRDYLNRISVFPSVSYETYVSPFYSEMNMAYIDNSENIRVDCSCVLSYYGTTPPDNYTINANIGLAYIPGGIGFNCFAVVSGITASTALPSEIKSLTFSILNQNITITKSRSEWKPSAVMFTVNDDTKVGDIVLTVEGRTFIGENYDKDLVISTLTSTAFTYFTTDFNTQIGGENVTSRYEVTIKVNNKIGADKYNNFKVGYYEYNGESVITPEKVLFLSGDTQIISGNSNSIIEYIYPSSGAYTIRDIQIKSYDINGKTYSNNGNPVNPSGNTEYFLYGKINGGVAMKSGTGFCHKVEQVNGITYADSEGSFSASTTNKKLSNPNGMEYSGSTSPISDITSFSYLISEGLKIAESGNSMTYKKHKQIFDEVSFGVFPEIKYNGSSAYTIGNENLEFYISTGTGKEHSFFTTSGYGYPVLINCGSTPTIPTNLETYFGNNSIITDNITSDSGYAYQPSQTKFIVGVYTVYDPNDTGSGTTRRVKTRLIKYYRNNEIKYIGN